MTTRILSLASTVAICLLVSACGGDGASPPSPQVGGTISGLSATGLVLANGSDTLAVGAGTTTFTMPRHLSTGDVYAITVATQPAGLTCLVAHGSGTVATTDVTSAVVTCNGPWTVTTVAGSDVSGTDDGPGASATFGFLRGLAIDSSGNVYVADWGQIDRLIRLVTSTGVVSTYAGIRNYSGSNFNAFGFPDTVALDGAGNLYVSDSLQDAVYLVKPDHSTNLVAQSGNINVYSPSALALDSAGNIEFGDNESGALWVVTPDGVVSQRTLSGPYATLYRPQSLAFDGTGNLYVAQANCTIVKISPAGVTQAAPGGDCTFGVSPGAYSLAMLTAAADGTLYIADNAGQVVRRLAPDGTMTILAGSLGVSGHADGSAATFSNLRGIALDGHGNVVVSDGTRLRKLLHP